MSAILEYRFRNVRPVLCHAQGNGDVCPCIVKDDGITHINDDKENDFALTKKKHSYSS
jgi:hypothetical protein